MASNPGSVLRVGVAKWDCSSVNIEHELGVVDGDPVVSFGQLHGGEVIEDVAEHGFGIAVERISVPACAGYGDLQRVTCLQWISGDL